jgi:hypothetical protein
MKQDITRQICQICHKPFYECECEVENDQISQGTDDEIDGFDEKMEALE